MIHGHEVLTASSVRRLVNSATSARGNEAMEPTESERMDGASLALSFASSDAIPRCEFVWRAGLDGGEEAGSLASSWSPAPVPGRPGCPHRWLGRAAKPAATRIAGASALAPVKPQGQKIHHSEIFMAGVSQFLFRDWLSAASISTILHALPT